LHRGRDAVLDEKRKRGNAQAQMKQIAKPASRQKKLGINKDTGLDREKRKLKDLRHYYEREARSNRERQISHYKNRRKKIVKKTYNKKLRITIPTRGVKKTARLENTKNKF